MACGKKALFWSYSFGQHLFGVRMYHQASIHPTTLTKQAILAEL